MKLRHAVFSGLGLSMVLVCVPGAYAKPSKATPHTPAIQKSSSILGGPITVTQSDFFTTVNVPVVPASLNQSLDGGFANQPIPLPQKRPQSPSWAIPRVKAEVALLISKRTNLLNKNS